MSLKELFLPWPPSTNSLWRAVRFAPTAPQRQREAFGPPEATYFTSASRMASGVS